MSLEIDLQTWLQRQSGLEGFRGFETAKATLERLFQRDRLEFVPDLKPSGKKTGTKATSHNAPVGRHLRVSTGGCDCPLLVKAVTSTSPNVLLGFVVVPDANRITVLEQNEAFVRRFMPDTLKKHESVLDMFSGVVARQIGEDVRNNFAQRMMSRAKKAEKLAALAAPFVVLPANIWESLRASVKERSADLFEYIEDMRSA